jgi:hypothetical protein
LDQHNRCVNETRDQMLEIFCTNASVEQGVRDFKESLLSAIIPAGKLQNRGSFLDVREGGVEAHSRLDPAPHASKSGRMIANDRKKKKKSNSVIVQALSLHRMQPVLLRTKIYSNKVSPLSSTKDTANLIILFRIILCSLFDNEEQTRS